MLVLSDIQKCVLSLRPETLAGNPVPIDGVPAWSMSNPAVLSLHVAADGLSAVVETLGPLGQCQVSAQADADIGEGVVTIAAILDVDVIASQAAVLNIAAGAPESRLAESLPAPKPVPEPPSPPA